MTLRLVPLAALIGLMLTAFVQSSSGAPMPNIQVGLEPQAGGAALTAYTAGPNAEAAFNVPPGIYFAFVASGSSLPGPATLTVIEGAQQRTSGVIPRVAGRVHAPHATAQGRMVVNVGLTTLVRLRLASHQPQAPSLPLCLTLPNGAPRLITAQRSSSGEGAYNAAMAAAQSEWSRQARALSAPGQPDYGDWTRAAQINVSSSVSGSPFSRTTTVTLTGQPCRRP